MPSDTVWVAMIGGGVTVASLGVQGWLNRGAENRRNQREDQLLKDNRDWQVKQQNVEERRESYGTLLRAASRIGHDLENLEWLLEDNEDQVEISRIRDSLRASSERLQATAGVVEVQSPDDEVVKLAQQAATIADDAAFMAGHDDPEAIKDLGNKLGAILAALRPACRRDLGFHVESRGVSDGSA
jgi:DNA repair ATPase RecN